jgi:DNA-binding transcriptional ArsR family regulator
MSLVSEITQVLVDHDATEAEAAAGKLVAIAETYTAALTHPVRGHILTILEAGRRSPVQISSELPGVSLGTVSYHVRCLADQGLIKLVATRPRRGAVEHFYEAR